MESEKNSPTKKDLKREYILNIARDIFSKYGYKKTTLDDIAVAIRKGKSSLYYYFESKEDLFQAVILNEAEILSKELDIVVNRNTDSINKLRDYILTKITTYRGLYNFYHAVENDTTAIDFIETVIKEYEEKEIRMIRRILVEGVRNNVFEIYDINLAAIAISTAIKGLELPLSSESYSDSSMEKSLDAILKIMCYGIAKR